MLLHVDPAGDLPIYEQIVRQVKFAIAAGALAAGDMVSSVRELAKELAINPNTVIRAYRQLQDEEILQSRRGTGLDRRSRRAGTCRRQRIDMIRCPARPGARRSPAERPSRRTRRPADPRTTRRSRFPTPRMTLPTTPTQPEEISS